MQLKTNFMQNKKQNKKNSFRKLAFLTTVLPLSMVSSI